MEDFPSTSQDSKLGTEQSENQLFFCIYSSFTLYNTIAKAKQTNKVSSVFLYIYSSYRGGERMQECNNSYSSFIGPQMYV